MGDAQRAPFVLKDLERVFFSGGASLSTREAQQAADDYAWLSLGLKPWEVNGTEPKKIDVIYWLAIKKYVADRQAGLSGPVEPTTQQSADGKLQISTVKGGWKRVS